MALELHIRHDLERLEKALEQYPRQFLAAAVRAQNRALTTVRAKAVAELAPEFAGLKRGAIRRQIALTKATATVPAAVLEFSARRFRLFGNFKARQTRHGVSIGRLPWRLEAIDGDELPREILAHAFIQRSRATGVPNVWLRIGTRRYPIIAIMVSGLAAAFRHRNFDVSLVALGRFRFRIELRREVQFRLSTLRGQAARRAA